MSSVRIGSVRLPLAVILVAALLIAPARSSAQDTQYWSDGYGMQARLLGGIVIGSDEDISAVYYNPGAVALPDSLQFLISLNALRYASLSYSIPNEATVPSSTGWSALSNMFAGTVPVGGRESHSRMAYSLMTRQSFVFGAQLRNIPLDSLATVPPPAPSLAVGNALVNQSLSEVWAGVTYAKESEKRWGYGVSLFIPIRSQTWSQSLSAQAVNGTGQTALSVREYDFTYYNWSLLLKFGVEYKAKTWSAGMNLTTPRLDLFGSGSVGTTRSYIDQGIAGGAGSTQIATAYEMNLSSTYHSPLAVGAGYGYRWQKTKLDISAEWFSSVGSFTILPAKAFVPQSGPPDSIPIALTARYRSVINVGVGVQHDFNARWNIYGAFRTDMSAIPTDSGYHSVGTLVNWNLLHANTGVQATIGRAAVILGFDLAWGSKSAAPQLTEPAPGLPTLPPIDQSFFSFTGALAFRFAY